MKEDLTVYDERTAPDKVAARNEHLSVVNGLLMRCHDNVANFQQLKLEIVNDMRTAGLRLNLCAGERHEQLLFTAAGLAFCRQHILPQLRPGTSIKELQVCVKLARQMKAPATTSGEAGYYLKLVEQELGLVGVEGKKPERLHAPRDVYAALLDGAKSFRATLEEAEKTRPLAQWARDDLESFVAEFRPMNEKYEAALAALAGREE